MEECILTRGLHRTLTNRNSSPQDRRSLLRPTQRTGVNSTERVHDFKASLIALRSGKTPLCSSCLNSPIARLIGDAVPPKPRHRNGRSSHSLIAIMPETSTNEKVKFAIEILAWVLKERDTAETEFSLLLN